MCPGLVLSGLSIWVSVAVSLGLTDHIVIYLIVLACVSESRTGRLAGPAVRMGSPPLLSSLVPSP